MSVCIFRERFLKHGSDILLPEMLLAKRLLTLEREMGSFFFLTVIVSVADRCLDPSQKSMPTGPTTGVILSLKPGIKNARHFLEAACSSAVKEQEVSRIQY